jgi:hypothetical protein
MIATENEAAPQNDFDLDRFYDVALKLTGYPPEIALFDPQLADSLNKDWLMERAPIEEAIESADVEQLLAEGLIRVWTDARGAQGFIPYSARQAGVFMKLKATGRYELAELQHIAESWGEYLEAVVVEEPPYDDRQVSDLENLRRRVLDNVAFFEGEYALGREREHLEPDQSARQFELTKERLAEWRQTAAILNGKTEANLSDHLRSAVQRHLWRLRWQDEWVRLVMAQKFETQLLQGYSVQVTFDGTTWENGATTLSNINWPSTFRRIRDMRREGRFFPLRMPDFNVTDKGVELLKMLTPDEYAKIYERDHMGEMYRVMDEMGNEIWHPTEPPLGNSVCSECQEPFDRLCASQIYCGERCRKRAKNRRWRERDPERVRQCQARYWKSYGDVN